MLKKKGQKCFFLQTLGLHILTKCCSGNNDNHFCAGVGGGERTRGCGSVQVPDKQRPAAPGNRVVVPRGDLHRRALGCMEPPHPEAPWGSLSNHLLWGISIDGIEDSLVLTFFLLVNNQQGKFFWWPKLSKSESFSSSGEILLKIYGFTCKKFVSYLQFTLFYCFFSKKKKHNKIK